MQKVSYIPLENILADDPFPRINLFLASTAHERITIG